MQYNVLDLFSGCGGLAYGFENNQYFDILLANDFWDPAKKTYQHNFPNTNFILDNISNLDDKKLKEIFPNGADVIIGGPPCQGFSMCGTRDASDKRNTLFKNYARVVKDVKPHIFLLENVKGLLSMKNPNGEPIIEAIYKEFKDLGYEINHRVVNAVYYGVPQSRERVIIVGVKDKSRYDFTYPEKKYEGENIVTVQEAFNGLPNKNSAKGELKYRYNDNMNSEYLDFIKSSNKKIYNHKKARHSKEVVNRMSYVPPGGNWRDIPEKHRVGGIHSNAYRRLELDKPSITIKHAFKSMIIHPVYDRCMTVREVARLQSFPDDFIFKGSKTSQYQQLANAVPPKLSIALSEAIFNYLLNNNITPKREQGLCKTKS